MFIQILSILIGPIGIILGIIVSEYFKRKDLKAIYGEGVFRKRFHIYEVLYEKMNTAHELGSSLIEKKDMSESDRLAEWSPVILDIASFLDKNRLYINQNISIHCTLSLVGVEEIAGLKGKEYTRRKDDYLKACKETDELIKEDSGLRRLEDFFTKVNKPKITSDWISYVEKMKAKR